ncbi:phosphate acetyltransferase [Candidatus Peregrinibacteria bacterium RIFOXYB2_FULL_32_7]|nr:MAG: phosphate acetyltransferase [Candidatus Peregrinibacteria bacterium RIFOXYB2_FULL_32_7]
MHLLEKFILSAQKNPKKIVLPEGTDERILSATNIIIENNIAEIILLGDSKTILQKAKNLHLQNIIKAEILNPETDLKREKYADLMVEIRKEKGLTKNEALKLLNDPLYFMVMMVKTRDADGGCGGAASPTANVIRPALQIIRTKPGIKTVSGAFIMITPDQNYGENGVFIFADCAVCPYPTEEQLAEIAITSADTAKNIAGIDPKIAMLGFSTKGTVEHEMCNRIIKAMKIAKTRNPNLQIDGELQADTAIVETVAKRKAPESLIAGKANVLIFPTLETGNIAYKLVQYLGNTKAIGPILQGLNAPINDMSRGCSTDDIIHIVAVTAFQAKSNYTPTL